MNENQSGHGAAVGSLVCGIVSCVCLFLGPGALASFILGIIGVVLASSSKKAGFQGGLRTAGLVLSIIGLIFGGIVFMACVACTGGLASLGSL